MDIINEQLSIQEIRVAKQNLCNLLNATIKNDIEEFYKKTGIKLSMLEIEWLNVTEIQDERPRYRINYIQLPIENITI